MSWECGQICNWTVCLREGTAAKGNCLRVWQVRYQHREDSLRQVHESRPRAGGTLLMDLQEVLDGIAYDPAVEGFTFRVAELVPEAGKPF